ncbi:helix-turn-helix domain-containing protein [Streptomyces sp. NPDC088258]|uniref:helix-turn-helix domain-containing protein n=1 Tax=Streptomyces sp. NPDC088258 TaxID=3365849 RepID=UPI0037F253BF
MAQHRNLSLTARGLGLYIQSLPDGVKIGIKTLAERFAEGEVAIAKALRELETYGYLSRKKVLVAGGRWVTRTVAYDMPRLRERAARDEAAAPTRQAPGTPVQRPVAPAQRPVAPVRDRAPAREVAPVQGPVAPAQRSVAPVRDRVPAREVAAGPPEVAAAPRAEVAQVRAPAPPLPEPDHPDLGRHRTAVEILAGLRRHDPRLLLSAGDVRRLATAVSTWLERGVEPVAVQRALTTLLPEGDIRRPAGLLAYRLTDQLPPPLPALPTPRRVDPLQNCDRCDHAFRAPEPGNCRVCLAEAPGRVPPVPPDS